MRLIDADKLRKDVLDLPNCYNGFSDTYDKACIIGVIDEQPSIDIVRCKDCKHFHYDLPYVIQGIPVLVHEICDFWGDGCKTSENNFCSRAERRTDEPDDIFK